MEITDNGKDFIMKDMPDPESLERYSVNDRKELNKLKGKAGVFFLRDNKHKQKKGGPYTRLAYIGTSADLKKEILRHCSKRQYSYFSTVTINNEKHRRILELYYIWTKPTPFNKQVYYPF